MGLEAGGLLGLGAAGLASAYGFNRANAMEQTGDQIAGDLYSTGTQLADGSTFKGYGVTSRLGNTSVGSDGSVNMGVGPNGQMQDYAKNALNNSQGLMGQAMQDPVVRQQQIYNQMMLAQQPQLNQMQAQQQAQMGGQQAVTNVAEQMAMQQMGAGQEQMTEGA